MADTPSQPPMSETQAELLVERIGMALALTIDHDYNSMLVCLPNCNCDTATPFILTASEFLDDMVKFVVFANVEKAREFVAEYDAAKENEKEPNAPSTRTRN